MEPKRIIAVVQCHLVKQRCSGYLCDRALHERTGGFADLPAVARPVDPHDLRLAAADGAVHRKLSNLIRQARKKEGIERSQILVQLSSCIVKDNYHGPPCPHVDYLKTLIGKLGLDIAESTVISDLSERRSEEGLYEG